MIFPPGVQPSKPIQVCKLIKSLYGIKHESRKWYEKLAYLLIHHGYKQATSNNYLFLKINYSSFTVFLYMFDNVILARNSLFKFQHIKDVFHQALKIKYLYTLKHFLGF